MLAPLPKVAAIMRDDEMMQGRPDVIANGMMGRVQELVAMGAHLSAETAQGTVTPTKLMQYTASLNQLSMILAHQGLALQAEAKRQQDIREEERRIALLANKSGEAFKLLRMLVSTYGADWRVLRQNDETGVTANVPMGKLICDVLNMREEQVEHMPPPPELTEVQRQMETTKARLRAGGGTMVDPNE